MFEKNINLIDFQTIFVTLVVCGVSISRVIPHVYNFSPVIALAIFGALHYKHRKLSYIVPLISLLFSDSRIVDWHDNPKPSLPQTGHKSRILCV